MRGVGGCLIVGVVQQRSDGTGDMKEAVVWGGGLKACVERSAKDPKSRCGLVGWKHQGQRT
jgi:hypothetical protein